MPAPFGHCCLEPQNRCGNLNARGFVRWLAPALALLLGWLPLASIAAPPAVTSLFPAGVPRGATTEITVEGTLDPWPVDAWCDRQGVTITAGKKKGQLSVQVADDVPPGVCFVRLHNADGAAAMKPLIIGHLPEGLEKEPNDSPSKPQAVAANGVTINGRFDKAGDVDVYAVELKAGQTLVAALESNFTLGKLADATLQVLDARGFVQAHNDDARGMDPLIAFEAPADGTYLVRTFSFPAVANTTIRYAGGPDLIYRLTITSGPYVDYVLPLAVASADTTAVQPHGWNLGRSQPIDILPAQPSDKAEFAAAFQPGVAGVVEVTREPHPVMVEQEPNGEPAQAQAISWPISVSGVIGSAGDVDVYRFKATKGDNLNFAAESWKLGYELDVYLTLTDTAGVKLKEIDDTVRNEREAELVHRFAADGEYLLHVRDLYQHGGSRYPYRVRVAPVEVAFTLTVTADRFAVPADKPLEIPVTVTRAAGFNGEIKVSLADLPEGLKCEPAISAPTGPTAKSIKLSVARVDGKTHSGPLQIVGEGAIVTKPPAEPGPAITRTATAPVEGTTIRQSRIWIYPEAAAKAK